MSVYIWGFGKLGQLGFGDRESVFVPKELVICKNGDRPAAIKSGGLFTAIQTRKGDVFVCGCGKYGRLGSGDDKDVLTPIKISPAKDAKVSQIAAGSWHACSVTYLGRLYTWGYNSKHNVLGRDCDKRCSFEPGLVTSLLKTKVKTVSCGHNFTLVSSEDGQVFSWGCGRYGVLGSGGEECVLQPSLISCLAKTKIRTVSAGYAHCGAVSEDGRLFMFGKGSDGALGFGLDLSNKSEPTWLKCDALITADVVDVSCSVGEHRGHTLVLTSCGTVFAFGSNYNGKLGVGDQETRLTPSRIPAEYLDNQPVVAISAGGVHSGAIVADGRVFTWGCGKDGRLGHPDFQAAPNSYHETRPKEVAAITKILGSTRRCVQISCSHYHTVVLVELK